MQCLAFVPSHTPYFIRNSRRHCLSRRSFAQPEGQSETKRSLTRLCAKKVICTRTTIPSGVRSMTSHWVYDMASALVTS